MGDINFVFFHIGDTTYPNLLVQSIKKFHPDSKIYFVTDKKTSFINGVYKTHRENFNVNKLMTSRLLGFKNLKLKEPAIYIDTDVLIVKKITRDLFENNDVFLCSRSFNRDKNFSLEQLRNLNLMEFRTKTVGEVYPFIACFTYSNNYEFWSECYKTLLNLDQKFHYWYGDQEALRIVYEKKIFNIGLLNESIVCTLPEHFEPGDGSFSIHFKGPARKTLMLQAANFILSENHDYQVNIKSLTT